MLPGLPTAVGIADTIPSVAADVVSKTVLQLLLFLMLPVVCSMSFAWWLPPPSPHLLILRCTWAEGVC